MAIFDDSDYIRKAYSELYLYCDPLKKPKWKVQNAGNIKKKSDTKCSKNLMPICHKNIWET